MTQIAVGDWFVRGDKHSAIVFEKRANKEYTINEFETIEEDEEDAFEIATAFAIERQGATGSGR